MEQIIGAVALALLTGGAGYAIREYQTRTSPFFEVLQVNTVFEGARFVPLDDFVVDRLERSELLWTDEVNSTVTLNQLNRLNAIANLVIDSSENVSPLIQEAVEAVHEDVSESSDLRLSKALSDLLTYNVFDQLMMRVLRRHKIPVNMSLVEKVSVFESPEHQNGTFWLNLPGGPGRSFVGRMNEPVIRGIAEPFVESVRRLDRASLREMLGLWHRYYSHDREIANQLKERLTAILNEPAQWMLRCMFANLSGRPVMIRTGAILDVRDASGGRYRPDCHLVTVGAGGANRDAEAPVLVERYSTLEFWIVTDQTQGEMDNLPGSGEQLRAAYDQGGAEAKVELQLIRPGLLRRQDVRSRTVSFVSEEDAARASIALQSA